MPSTWLWYLAIKKQSAAETAVKPTNFIRFDEGDLKKTLDNILNTPIQNNRWKNLSIKKATENGEWQFTLDFDFNETPRWIFGALGTLTPTDISSATDASVIQNAITFANTLPSFSLEQCQWDITDTAGNKQRYIVKRWFGAKIDSFTLKAAEGDVIQMDVALQMLGIFDKANLIDDADAGSSVVVALDTVDGLVATSDSVCMHDETPQDETDEIASLSAANKTITIATLWASFTVANKAKVELAPQSPSYATEPEHAGLQDCTIQMGDDITAAASATEMNVDEWEFSYNNNTNVKRGTKLGRVNEQRSTAQFKFKKFFETKEERDNYLNNSKQALILTITNNKVISATDTGLKKYQMVLRCPNIRYQEFDIPTGNDTIFEIEASCEVLYDTSAGYAVDVTFQNAKAGTYYTA